jgi:hypothetical protein
MHMYICELSSLDGVTTLLQNIGRLLIKRSSDRNIQTQKESNITFFWEVCSMVVDTNVSKELPVSALRLGLP